MQDLKPMLSRSSNRFPLVVGAIAILAGLTLWFVWPRADKTVVVAPQPTPKAAPGVQPSATPAAPAPAAPPPGSPEPAPEGQLTQPAAIVAHPTPIAETARIEFTNHLLTSDNVQGSDPLLTGGSGRLWATPDGDLRVEL